MTKAKNPINKTLFKSVAVSALLLNHTAIPQAIGNEPSNTVLSLEKPVMTLAEIHFENPDNIHPKSSDFKIVSFVLMSSEAGERRAVITFENTSSGQRFLEQDHLLAIFANGERKYPEVFREKFSGNEIRTLDLSFNFHKYPVLTLYTDN